ncbi:hypothetical protein FACS1894158_05770 [Betaproteobacteria bacterium]|nr:hypothetical protein FACS1894158_05770 [Betaproteobacteria bacterium]
MQAPNNSSATRNESGIRNQMSGINPKTLGARASRPLCPHHSVIPAKAREGGNDGVKNSA